MATYAELKARIIREVNRDDLGSGEELELSLTKAIARAIEFYQDRRFWFNQTIATAVTVASVQNVTRPATIRTIDRLSIASLDQELEKRSLAYIESLADQSPQTGQPYDYAEYGDYVRLWPIPNAVYTLKFVGVLQEPALSADADENVWTTHAEDLIAARARMLLWRDQFNDPRIGNAQAAEAEALGQLRSETVRRLGGPLHPAF